MRAGKPAPVAPAAAAAAAIQPAKARTYGLLAGQDALVCRLERLEVDAGHGLEGGLLQQPAPSRTSEGKPAGQGRGDVV